MSNGVLIKIENNDSGYYPIITSSYGTTISILENGTKVTKSITNGTYPLRTAVENGEYKIYRADNGNLIGTCDVDYFYMNRGNVYTTNASVTKNGVSYNNGLYDGDTGEYPIKWVNGNADFDKASFDDYASIYKTGIFRFKIRDGIPSNTYIFSGSMYPTNATNKKAFGQVISKYNDAIEYQEVNNYYTDIVSTQNIINITYCNGSGSKKISTKYSQVDYFYYRGCLDIGNATNVGLYSSGQTLYNALTPTQYYEYTDVTSIDFTKASYSDFSMVNYAYKIKTSDLITLYNEASETTGVSYMLGNGSTIYCNKVKYEDIKYIKFDNDEISLWDSEDTLVLNDITGTIYLPKGSVTNCDNIVKDYTLENTITLYAFGINVEENGKSYDLVMFPNHAKRIQWAETPTNYVYEEYGDLIIEGSNYNIVSIDDELYYKEEYSINTNKYEVLSASVSDENAGIIDDEAYYIKLVEVTEEPYTIYNVRAIFNIKTINLTLHLYKIKNTERNILNRLKSNTIVEGTIMYGHFTEETSILYPSIDIDASNLENVFEYNYAYIEDLNRYYFVKDVINIGKDLWRFPLEVDVLESNKYAISRGNNHIIRGGKGSAGSCRYVDTELPYLPTSNKYSTALQLTPSTPTGWFFITFKCKVALYDINNTEMWYHDTSSYDNKNGISGSYVKTSIGFNSNTIITNYDGLQKLISYFRTNGTSEKPKGYIIPINYNGANLTFDDAVATIKWFPYLSGIYGYREKLRCDNKNTNEWTNISTDVVAPPTFTNEKYGIECVGCNRLTLLTSDYKRSDVPINDISASTSTAGKYVYDVVVDDAYFYTFHYSYQPYNTAIIYKNKIDSNNDLFGIMDIYNNNVSVQEKLLNGKYYLQTPLTTPVEFKISDIAYIDSYGYYKPKTLYIHLIMNDTGICNLVISRVFGSNVDILQNIECDCFVDIPLYDDGNYQANVMESNSMNKAIFGSIASVLGIAGGVASGNALVVAGGVAGLSKTISNNIEEQKQRRASLSVSNLTASGKSNAVIPSLIVSEWNEIYDANNVISEKGILIDIHHTTITSYTYGATQQFFTLEIEDLSLFNNITETEISMIKALCLSGIKVETTNL